MLIIEALLLLTVFFFVASIAWSTIRVGISPMPSSQKAIKEMLQLTESTGDGPIYDLGSGWGTIVVRLARKYPQRQIVGYEISLLPYLVSLFLKKLFHIDNLTLYRQDFTHANLSAASVVVCYLFPGGMEKLTAIIDIAQDRETSSDNAKLKCRPDFIISNSFAFPSLQPEQEICLEDMYRLPVYRYQLK
ncbi:SAM-dependent methyltransferase [Veronia nyctiphanis]|uniref:SAM-dependent methyltransferase n=1 Tax=Veronia nyctiphanis TaxID=1278244 RepID=A0A4Q0YNB9_9GAMM|nr:class I SAM-dependent methyltransferase [Veronia nyctiphanis]RXJ71963.1 SAM-dependent methyltransferase [Veronia nyctiphanis]